MINASWCFRKFFGQFLGVEGEKVTSQHLGDAPEKVGVDRVLLEETIDIRTVEVDFSREPCHTALLRDQLVLYYLSDWVH